MGISMNLSEHFTIEQLTKSQTASRKGINEQFNPNEEIKSELKELCINLLEKVLLLFPNMSISSGYRCGALNAAIGGANTSQHTKGQAADVEAGTGKSNIELAKSVLSANIVFDQMIVEFGTLEKPDWIHLSYNKTHNRGQILRAEVVNGKTEYLLLTKEQVLAIK